jgi:uncharacterized protein YaaQ
VKLIIAIIQQDDLKDVLDNLLSQGYRVTKVKSVGGFLEISNIILFIGVDKEKVPDVLEIINKHCHSRDKYVETLPFNLIEGFSGLTLPVKVTVGGAQIFILDVEKFIRY